MFPIVAYVFFVWLWLQLVRNNGLRQGIVFLLLGGGVLAGAIVGWYPVQYATIGVCALSIVMILLTWGRDPWS